MQTTYSSILVHNWTWQILPWSATGSVVVVGNLTIDSNCFLIKYKSLFPLEQWCLSNFVTKKNQNLPNCQD
ncbi:hypothetical protein [[Phormidium ambiguum] IAM M-71]|uniref:hypothetical protein n=1 Tax=[Phormidium ambiguum] IAM M-71 TaxID=454136 RepID=UPI00116107B7|nr:hypothetical protein [Phormidium ambiguum]